MKKFAFVLVLSLAAYGKSFTGYVSDEKCGKGHSDGSEKSSKCVAGCMKGGKAAVLVVDGEVMKVAAASQDKLKDHAGHKVTVEGKVEHGEIAIDSVKMAH